ELELAERGGVVADQVDRPEQVHAEFVGRRRRLPVPAPRVEDELGQPLRVLEEVVELLEECPGVVLVEALQCRVDLGIGLDEWERQVDERLHVRCAAPLTDDPARHGRDIEEDPAPGPSEAARNEEDAYRTRIPVDAGGPGMNVCVERGIELVAARVLGLVVMVVQAAAPQHAQPARAIVDDDVLQVTERVPVEPAVQVAVLRAEVALGVPPRVEVAERDEALLRIRQSFLHGRVQLLEIIAVQQKELEGALFRPCSEALTVVIAEELVQTAQHVPTRTTQPDEQRGMDLLQSWYRHRYLQTDRGRSAPSPQPTFHS